MAVVVAVPVGVAEQFVSVRVRVAVEPQQCDGSHEERAGKKLRGPHGLVEYHPREGRADEGRCGEDGLRADRVVDGHDYCFPVPTMENRMSVRK